MKKGTLKEIVRVGFGLATLTGLLLALPQTSQSAPPISISGCTSINSPGHYRLDADLTFATGPATLPSASTCITIAASKVDLDLNGHTITGPGGGSDGTGGISVTAQTKVDIKGPGVISGFGRGIDFDGGDILRGETGNDNGQFLWVRGEQQLARKPVQRKHFNGKQPTWLYDEWGHQ